MHRLAIRRASISIAHPLTDAAHAQSVVGQTTRLEWGRGRCNPGLRSGRAIQLGVTVRSLRTHPTDARSYIRHADARKDEM
jgi:hypothetical protein